MSDVNHTSSLDVAGAVLARNLACGPLGLTSDCSAQVLREAICGLDGIVVELIGGARRLRGAPEPCVAARAPHPFSAKEA